MSSYSNPSGNCVECLGDWKTSSYSSDSFNCVEFTKSSYSSASNCCVEVARPAEILVRDSKNRDQGHLTFAQVAWAAFIDDIKDGLDRPKA
jgi:hypothetical protein